MHLVRALILPVLGCLVALGCGPLGGTDPQGGNGELYPPPLASAEGHGVRLDVEHARFTASIDGVEPAPVRHYVVLGVRLHNHGREESVPFGRGHLDLIHADAAEAGLVAPASPATEGLDDACAVEVMVRASEAHRCEVAFEVPFDASLTRLRFDVLDEGTLNVFLSDLDLVLEPAQADILLVIDDSCSMPARQQRLAAHLDFLVGALLDGVRTADFRIAVTSTSIHQRMRIIQADGSETIDHRTTYAIGSDHPCADATLYQFDADDPYPAGRLMAAPGNPEVLTSADFLADRSGALTRLRENVVLGACGSVQEQGLAAALLALARNDSFIHSQSDLLIFFLSDEEDASDESGEFAVYEVEGGQVIDRRLEGVDSAGNTLTPVAHYAAALTSLAEERRGSVAVFPIVSAIDDAPDLAPGLCLDTTCVAGCPDYCETDYCPRFCARLTQRDGETAEAFEQRQAACPDECYAACTAVPTEGPCFCGGISPGARYMALADALPGSRAESVCHMDLNGLFGAIADALLRY